MSRDAYYKILNISPKSGQKEVKKAYRRLAMKYHPDRNNTALAAKRFQEISEAYDVLMKEKPLVRSSNTKTTPNKGATNRHGKESTSPNKEKATSHHRDEQKKARARSEKRKQKKEEAQKDYKKNKFHDLILFSEYFIRILALIFSIAAIITPFALAIFIEPKILVATFFFVIIGSFLLWHIIDRRKTWFNLGKFHTTPETIRDVIKKITTRRNY